MLNLAVKPSDPDNESAFWNAADIGIYLNMHQSTVWDQLAKGLIPKPVRRGKWRKEDLILYVECDCNMKKYRQQKKEQGE